MQRFKILFPLVIMTTTFTGCGKVAKETVEIAASASKKGVTSPSADENLATDGARFKNSVNEVEHAGLKAYMAVKITSSAARAMKEQTSKVTPFELHPYRAILEGETILEDSTQPAKFSLSLSKGCEWLAKLAVTTFVERAGAITRIDGTASQYERLDRQVLYEESFQRVALVDNPQASDGEILSEEKTEELVTKKGTGFIVEYKNTDKQARQSSVPALFYGEAEQHRLNLIERGVYDFSYRHVDTSAETLFTEEVTKVYPLEENPLKIDLWKIDTDSYEVVDGENQVTAHYSEIVNSNGVPVYVRFEIDGMKLDGWLKEFSALPVDRCSTD